MTVDFPLFISILLTVNAAVFVQYNGSDVARPRWLIAIPKNDTEN
jgi:hypothetical protein